MKKNLLSAFILLPLLSVFHQKAATQAFSQMDCYRSYKKQGDTYKARGYYDLAVQQYKYAKYCRNVTPAQKSELDSLIADANRMAVKRRVIIKRY